MVTRGERTAIGRLWGKGGGLAVEGDGAREEANGGDLHFILFSATKKDSILM